MGLISKIKASGATALGALKARILPVLNKIKSTPIAAKVIGGASKLIALPGVKQVTKVAAFGAKKIGPLGTAITVASVAVGSYKYIKKKVVQKQCGIQSSAKSAEKKSGIQTASTAGLASGAKKYLTTGNLIKAGAAAVAAGGLAYGAYKAYKALTKKKKKKKAKKKSKRYTKRYTRRRKKAPSSGRRVSFTTKDGRKVSFMPKRRKTVRFSGYRKRKGTHGLSNTEIHEIKSLIRRGERD